MLAGKWTCSGNFTVYFEYFKGNNLLLLLLTLSMYLLVEKTNQKQLFINDQKNSFWILWKQKKLGELLKTNCGKGKSL